MTGVVATTALASGSSIIGCSSTPTRASKKTQTPENNERSLTSKNFKDWQPTPPLGWNSYDCWGAAVTEKEVKQNADYMKKHLHEFGWEYVVVDYCWFYPHPPGSIQDNPPQFRLKKDNAPVPWIPMDDWGRLLPAERKFPSAKNGVGFKALGDYIHSLGLKFGIHQMRGIPRQAVWAKTPIKGAPGIDASMIADKNSICRWLNTMYGVDMSKPGAQAYYDSLIELYASWGVDYIKIDDINGNRPGHPYHAAEVEAMRKAIDKVGRPIVLSLSLHLKYEDREHLKKHANLWRISKDFWDDWEALKAQFDMCHKWEGEVGEGYGPDADMLPLGPLSLRGPKGESRMSGFTPDEQLTHMTLWYIFKSPMMMGGHMPGIDDYVLGLLANEELIYVNQQGKNPRQLYREGSRVAWVSEDSHSNDKFVALFNIGEQPEILEINAQQLALRNSRFSLRELWQKKNLGEFDTRFRTEIRPHAAKIFRLKS